MKSRVSSIKNIVLVGNKENVITFYNSLNLDDAGSCVINDTLFKINPAFEFDVNKLNHLEKAQTVIYFNRSDEDKERKLKYTHNCLHIDYNKNITPINFLSHELPNALEKLRLFIHLYSNKKSIFAQNLPKELITQIFNSAITAQQLQFYPNKLSFFVNEKPKKSTLKKGLKKAKNAVIPYLATI